MGGRFDARMVFVPEGQCDRSQARSAWNNATPKRSRPVGYGVIRAGMRAGPMIGVMEISNMQAPDNYLSAYAWNPRGISHWLATFRCGTRRICADRERAKRPLRRETAINDEARRVPGLLTPPWLCNLRDWDEDNPKAAG
jgi:hypothetical protein